MEGRMWSPLNKTGSGHHCSCVWSRTGRAGVHETADFTSIFMEKIQNKQPQNDYQKAFSSCAARKNIKNVFSG